MADPTNVDGRPVIGNSSTPVTIMNSSVPTNIVVQDIEIGAVEIKNATDDTRAIVDSSGRLNVHDLEVLTVPTQVIKTVAATGTPEALAANNTFFSTALIGGVKAARTANVGIVYLGIGSGNDTQPFAINPSEWLTINAPVGQKFDLNDWYLDVLNAGDGVAIIYS